MSKQLAWQNLWCLCLCLFLRLHSIQCRPEVQCKDWQAPSVFVSPSRTIPRPIECEQLALSTIRLYWILAGTILEERCEKDTTLTPLSLKIENIWQLGCVSLDTREEPDNHHNHPMLSGPGLALGGASRRHLFFALRIPIVLTSLVLVVWHIQQVSDSAFWIGLTAERLLQRRFRNWALQREMKPSSQLPLSWRETLFRGVPLRRSWRHALTRRCCKDV